MTKQRDYAACDELPASESIKSMRGTGVIPFLCMYYDRKPLIQMTTPLIQMSSPFIQMSSPLIQMSIPLIQIIAFK